MKTFDFNDEEKLYFGDVMKKLGNNNKLLQSFQENQENNSNEKIFEQIQIDEGLNNSIDEVISFISSNFHDFNIKYPEAIFKFDVDIVEQIVSNTKLKLYDEEELFDIVLKLYQKSNEYSSLFSYVIFVNLSSESIRKFNEIFDVNDINLSIWKNICKRLEHETSCEFKDEYKKTNLKFLENRYVPKRYDDIIQQLSEKCHGNVHTKNIVNITHSSYYGYKVQNIVKRDDGKIFATNNGSNSWIQFDFKERRVLLDSYTLKTMNWESNNTHLKSWIIEVSNDGENYIEIDRHENIDLLNGPLKTATFLVSCPTPQRFVRLRQIGPNWMGSNYLYINQVEFSGFLYE